MTTGRINQIILFSFFFTLLFLHIVYVCVCMCVVLLFFFFISFHFISFFCKFHFFKSMYVCVCVAMTLIPFKFVQSKKMQLSLSLFCFFLIAGKLDASTQCLAAPLLFLFCFPFPLLSLSFSFFLPKKRTTTTRTRTTKQSNQRPPLNLISFFSLSLCVVLCVLFSTKQNKTKQQQKLIMYY